MQRDAETQNAAGGRLKWLTATLLLYFWTVASALASPHELAVFAQLRATARRMRIIELNSTQVKRWTDTILTGWGEGRRCQWATRCASATSCRL